MINVILHGDAVTDDGYSRIASNFIHATKSKINWIQNSAYARKSIKSRHEHSPIAFHHNPAISTRTIPKKYNVLMTMWETSQASAPFLAKADEMDEVWFPTPYNMRAFDKISAKKLVVPYPMPVWLDDLTVNPGRPYRFLFIGTWYARKSPEVLIQAFADEFGRNDGAELWLKRTIFQKSNYMTLAQMTHEFKPEAHIVDVKVRLNDMRDLYNKCDCVVLPSRGEGYGMPAIEGGLHGLDIIVSDCSSLEDIFAGTSAALVQGKARKVGDLFNSEPAIAGWTDPESECFEPSVKSLRVAMRYAYENPGSLGVREQLLAKDDGGKALIENLERVYADSN